MPRRSSSRRTIWLNADWEDGGLIQNALETVKGPAGKAANKFDPLTHQYAKLIKTGLRTPVMKRPGDIGMDYEGIDFPPMDGVPLVAWFIPIDSDRLLIINHPMTCNRHGLPGHLREFTHLHDAGYNSLTCDLRNCGPSGESNGGISAQKGWLWRDRFPGETCAAAGAGAAAASTRSAKDHPVEGTMRASLFSRRMGGNSTVIAMNK